MVIYTNSGKIKKYRKLIVELLLAAHCRDCTTCVKSGECVLQELAHRLGVHNIRFENTREERPIDVSSPSIVRDPNKCILCGNCVRACEELQGVGALGFAFRGTDAMVMPAFDKQIAETQCVNCGQCRVFCPTGAISIHTNVTIAAGAHVPTVTMNIQRAIRSYIELNCGVAVREVSVSVNALESGEATRHGRKKAATEPAPQAVETAAPVEDASLRLHVDPIMDAPTEEAAVQDSEEQE